jgi:hypothetical protein
MLNLANRIKVKDQNIYLKKAALFNRTQEIVEGVLEFSSSLPIITIFEDAIAIREYKIESLSTNPTLRGQFLHYSISLQANNAVIIDGIISKDKNSHPLWNEEGYEAIRFQPFYLKKSRINNTNLIGKGLFERGLHFNGTITPSGVRCICICDYCSQSFTIQHVHAGFSQVQYFYSSDSMATLLVRYDEIENIPTQLQKEISIKDLMVIEEKLSELTGKDFKFYNSFCCPHCNKPFIDFEKNKAIRPSEYYANKFINSKFLYLEDLNQPIS